MKRARGAVRRPYVVRDFEFIREGPDGTLWQAADGMTVQIAAAERPGRHAGESEASDASHVGHGIHSDSGRARAC
jgi:hypothetical protein